MGKLSSVILTESGKWLFVAAALVLAYASAGSQPGGKGPRASVDSIETPAPDLGKVASATTGDTVFTVSAGTGAVTRSSGTGSRVSSGTTRSLITVSCTGGGLCGARSVDILVGSIGSPTGRARALTNFTVAEVTADITSGPTGTNPISFTIAPIGNNNTKTFWVGADFPIAGNESGLPTGAASSGFYVSADMGPPNNEDVGNGLAIATVFRPIVVGLDSNLSFGTVTRPREGSGSVAIDASTGTRTVTGTGAEGINLPASSRAAFTVTGEGGQTISVSVPPTFIMSGPGPDLTVTTNNTAPGTQFLSSAIGSEGSYSFHVGGSFPTNSATPTGDYTGSFTVMVQYN